MRPTRLSALLLAATLAFAGTASFAADGGVFTPTPDHEPNPAVPHGTVTPMPAWHSTIFPNTTRDWWIYVPAQYKPDGSAALMVFQDGSGYIGPKGVWRVPTVFDNLIARGEMPVTIAIFINPGNDPAKGPPKKGASHSNRSLEYNSLGDRYARFLLEEILPEVAKTYPFSSDPEKRAIAGSSSGGIAAFTVAWERPDQFRKVFTTVGSFVNLAGGDAYPALIRKTERKPLRVYQQDSSGDLDNPYGKWPLANQAVHASLKYMGYDCHLEFAEGFGHNGNHGGSIFPAAMRWLWRAEKPTPVIVTKGDLAGDMTLHRLLIEGEGWQPVVEGLGSADAACTDRAGNFYFSDPKAPAIYKLAADGTKTKLSAELASGLKFGSDGRLYACHGGAKRLFTLDPTTGTVEVLATDVTPNDLVLTRSGYLYFTETAAKQVVCFDLKTKTRRVVATDLAAPNGLTLSPDEGTLAVSEHGGEFVWTFRVNADGALDAKSPYMSMRRPVDPKGDFKFNNPPPYLPAARGDGMTIDTLGRYYVTTALGVQVFDPTGRLCGVLEKPSAKGVSSCVLAGPEHNYLYVTAGPAIYRRKLQATGL
jgi:sugar lactone lactonase YvrE/enterochelin esterase-like enzyme